MISATNIYCLNEQGKRSNNEDCISPVKGSASPKEKLFVVCDGVGGENKGEVASEIVCTSIRHFYELNQGQPFDRIFVLDAIEYASQQLAAYAQEDRSARRMSTTLALALICPSSVLVAWCGDSRIHHIRNGRILWMSNDHSLVHELVKSGELSEKEAATHPQRNIITRSLNAANRNNLVDVHEITNLEEGDYLLLCTDGFLEQVNKQVIATVLDDPQIENKAAAFLDICSGKTRDNYSMYLVGLTLQQKQKTGNLLPKILLIVLLLVIIGALVIALV